ncbi:MAG: Ig-like domain-containing protein [Erysipelotrichales bacterium]|nr:Ig-like domain-containing protein [Erysipelotrichales bacterium]
MKKIIILMMLATVLVSCGQISNDSGSLDDLLSASTSNELDSSLKDSASTLPSTSASNTPNYPNVIDSELLLRLIYNAPFADLNIVKSSETNFDIYGYENGIRYHQTQTIIENTYSNDITIGSGTVNHYYINDTYVYESDFTTLRMLQNDIYYDITIYDSEVFTSTTDAMNLNWYGDDLESLREEARIYVSSGVGYEAYTDFVQGYNLGSTIAYTSEYVNNDLSVTIYMEYESGNTNQYYIATFSYLFDVNDLHIKSYVAEQSYYSYLAYQSNNNSIEGLTPIDYVLQETTVNTGKLSEFTGELPFDIDSLFVQEINLSAAVTQIKVGETVALKAEVLPKTAIDRSLKYSSSNEAVAVVDYSGRVRGLTPGTCTIIAENIYSGVTGKIDITVLPEDKPDVGDDSEKRDLKEALSVVSKQVFSTPTNLIDDGEMKWSSVGMIIDNEQSIDSEALAMLTVSDFAYNAVLRKATYVGDMEKLESIIPFLDNGIENLSNRYLIKTYIIYREVIVSFELVLSATNTIDYVKLTTRTDYIESETKIDTTNLNNDNVESVGTLHINSYGTRNVFYESRGFVYEEE